MIPPRVAVGLMILGGLFGFLVGEGATPWVLLVLPGAACTFISINIVH